MGPVSRPGGQVREDRLVGQPEGGLDQRQECLRVAQQVVGLARTTARVRPASAAARLLAPAAKNADHSASSGATWGSSAHTLRGRLVADGRVRTASTAAAVRSAARWAAA